MTTRKTAKTNGYKLQKFLAEKIRERFNLEERDVVSTPSSVQGEDILLTNKARSLFPFSTECKYRENMSIYKFWEQATNNCGDYNSLLILKAKRKPVLACIELDVLLDLLETKSS